MLPGFRAVKDDQPQAGGSTLLTVTTPLSHMLSASRNSIDDVVNCPIAKRQVQFYFKVTKSIARQKQIKDLEKQWNPAA